MSSLLCTTLIRKEKIIFSFGHHLFNGNKFNKTGKKSENIRNLGLLKNICE
jgi:hypothetical protein